MWRCSCRKDEGAMPIVSIKTRVRLTTHNRDGWCKGGRGLSRFDP
jgi:hypothetical protein